MKRRSLFPRDGLAVGAALLPSVARAQGKPPIKVGAILPMTGFGASYGELFHTAHLHGGGRDQRQGRRQRQPHRARGHRRPARRAAVGAAVPPAGDENVVAVIGPVSGTSWENVAPIANAMKTPALNYSAVKPGITVKPYALRPGMASDTLAPDGVAEFMKRFPEREAHRGHRRRAGSLRRRRRGGVEEGGDAGRAAGRGRGRVPDQTTDFAPVVSKIRSLNPDAVFTCSLAPTTLPLVKEMETQRFDKPVVDCGLVERGQLHPRRGHGGKELLQREHRHQRAGSQQPAPGALHQGIPEALAADQAAAAGQRVEHQRRRTTPR